MSTMNPINLEHNHEQDEKKIERHQLRAQVKRKATDDLTSRPSKIIWNELHKFADQLIGSGDVRSIAQSLYRERWKVYPILPKSREDVHAALESMATLTSKEEEFVQVNNIKTEIVILSCLSSLEFLVNLAEEIFIDGTFKCCPKYFYQLYTIHGLRNGHFIPLVYALLPGKSEVNYRDMWTSLIASCSARNLQLQVSVNA